MLERILRILSVLTDFGDPIVTQLHTLAAQAES